MPISKYYFFFHLWIKAIFKLKTIHFSNQKKESHLYFMCFHFLLLFPTDFWHLLTKFKAAKKPNHMDGIDNYKIVSINMVEKIIESVDYSIERCIL